MLFYKIRMAIYAMLLTNIYGFKLKNISSHSTKKTLRLEYAEKLLSKLNIKVKVKDKHKLPTNGQFLLISNHRSIIDPLIIEIALKETTIFGLWVAKEELSKSIFFSSFVKNAGTILLNRDSKSVRDLFKKIKSYRDAGDSIFIFPEGTRNKNTTDLSDFKSGTRLIALKNRLPILPLYIRTNAEMILKSALQKSSKPLEIVIEIGDVIDYKTKFKLEEIYRKMFTLEEMSKNSDKNYIGL